jgi:hypothetical protein
MGRVKRKKEVKLANSRLDAPLIQMKILSRIRRTGTESEVWQGFCSRALYMLYKRVHPEFALKVEQAKRHFFAGMLKDDPELHEKAVEWIKRYLSEGEVTRQSRKTVARKPPSVNPETKEEIPGEITGVEESTTYTQAPTPQWVIEKFLQ